MKKGCGMSQLGWWLLVIGAINWGLVAAFGFNVVEMVFGSVSWLLTLVYVLIGLSGVMALFGCKCKSCKA